MIFNLLPRYARYERVNSVTQISPALLPLAWGAGILSGIAALALMIGLTLLLGSQRPFVLHVIWVSASVLIASATALVLILTY